MTIGELREKAKRYTENFKAKGLNVEIIERGAYGMYNFDFEINKKPVKSTGYGNKKQVSRYMDAEYHYMMNEIETFKKLYMKGV